MALWGLTRVSRAMMFPASAAALPPAEILAPLGVTMLECPSADGLALRAAWARPRGATVGVLLYFHGNAESAAQNVDLALWLAQRNWEVVLAEYRGYGGLPGRPSEKGLYTDGEAVLSALARAGVPSQRLILVGRSLGTGVAVELARRGHGRALLLVSPYTSMVEMGRLVAGPLARLAVVDRFDSAAKAGALRIPSAVIHGERDEVVPIAMGETIAGLLPGCRFVPVSDRGHNDLDELPELIDREARRLLVASR